MVLLLARRLESRLLRFVLSLDSDRDDWLFPIVKDCLCLLLVRVLVNQFSLQEAVGLEVLYADVEVFEH